MHFTEFQELLHINQDFYVSKIEQIPIEADLSKSTSMRMKLAWIASPRPDLVFELSQIAQVTRTMFE